MERIADEAPLSGLETSLAVPNKHRVCFIYDERMALHRNVNEP